MTTRRQLERRAERLHRLAGELAGLSVDARTYADKSAGLLSDASQMVRSAAFIYDDRAEKTGEAVRK